MNQEQKNTQELEDVKTLFTRMWTVMRGLTTPRKNEIWNAVEKIIKTRDATHEAKLKEAVEVATDETIDLMYELIGTGELQKMAREELKRRALTPPTNLTK